MNRIQRKHTMHLSSLSWRIWVGSGNLDEIAAASWLRKCPTYHRCGRGAMMKNHRMVGAALLLWEVSLEPMTKTLRMWDLDLSLGDWHNICAALLPVLLCMQRKGIGNCERLFPLLLLKFKIHHLIWERTRCSHTQQTNTYSDRFHVVVRVLDNQSKECSRRANAPRRTWGQETRNLWLAPQVLR